MTFKVIILGDAGTGKTSLRAQYLYKTFSFSYRATIGANFVTKECTVSSNATPSVNMVSRKRQGSEYTLDGNASIPQSFHSMNTFHDWPSEYRLSRSAISESPSLSSLRLPTTDCGIQPQTTKVSLCIWDTAGQERFNALSPTFFRGADCAVLLYDLTNPGSLDSLVNHHKQFLKHCGSKDPLIILVGNKVDAVPPLQARAVFGATMHADRASRVLQRDIDLVKAQIETQTRQQDSEGSQEVYSDSRGTFPNHSAIEAYEVSAKLGTSVDVLFQRIAEQCQQRMESVSARQLVSFDVEEGLIDIKSHRHSGIHNGSQLSRKCC